ncbi:hypothetical protein ACXPWS_27900 [Mycobacterium sp. BMJ-28]
MSRHALASGRRSRPLRLPRPSVALAGLVVPVAVLAAAAGDVQPLAATRVADPVAQNIVTVADSTPYGLEIVAAPAAFSSSPTVVAPQVNFAAAQTGTASRWRVDTRPLLLPVGLAPERGLQVRTILASRAISVTFPEIHSIGGVRPDALRWHPDGLALDVMIPNPGSASGIALGNEIVAYVLKNAVRFGIQDAIWRGVYYTPGGAQRGGYGHFDHVHVTTTGGGYPSGDEVYAR